jgi:hypothetical protein
MNALTDDPDPSDVTGVALRLHFDDDLSCRSGAQNRIDGGKLPSNRMSTTLPRTDVTAPRFTGLALAVMVVAV